MALTLLVTAASLLAHVALARAPFLLPALAILLSAYVGGLGPGLLATVACSAIAGLIFLTPPDASVLRDWPYLTRFALTIVGGSLASVLMGALRRERARAEQAAAEAERLYQDALAARQEALTQAQQLQAVLAGIVDGVTAQRPDGQLLYANEAAARITGYSSVEDMLATPSAAILDRFEILREDGRPLPLDELPGRVALRGEKPASILIRYRSKDAPQERWVVVSAQPLLGSDGSVQMAINMMHDVTAEKFAESQKAAFLSSLAHDLKTPLTAIKGISQLMIRRLNQGETPADGWLADELQRFDVTAGRMSTLVDELEEIEHIGSARGLDLARSSFDLAELAQSIASELAPTTGLHRVEVCPSGDPVIGQWDKDRLGRVIANLIENAIKYSPDGGDIIIGLGQDHATARLTVTDHGIGVPESERQRVFERFQRGSNVPSFVSGTGVGLAYAAWVAAQHGGSLTVDTAAGGGSVFTLELPLADV